MLYHNIKKAIEYKSWKGGTYCKEGSLWGVYGATGGMVTRQP